MQCFEVMDKHVLSLDEQEFSGLLLRLVLREATRTEIVHFP